MFTYCEISNFDIFKSIFLVRFEAKGLYFGLLPIFLTIGGILWGWLESEFALAYIWDNILTKMAFFGCNFAHNSFKMRFLTLFIVPHVGANTKSKILPTPGEAKAKAMPGRLYIHT